MSLPTVILPGYLAGANAYLEMEQALGDLGFPTTTVPLKRRDWLPTLGGRSVTPILQQLDQTVKRVMQQYGSDRINLIGHSAGGWISRIYLGEKPYCVHPVDAKRLCLWKAHPSVATLVTLGTPHVSREPWTLRNLDFVKDNYPGAFYPGIRYVCVEMTCGIGGCWGDGITPIEAAHLEGAENLVIDGVFHSPRPGRLWYGSPQALEVWAKYLA
jgi:pimeloyl-ACP methyl ester carboxylesterase